MLIGNDGSRLGTIAEVYADERGAAVWLAVRVRPDRSDVRLVPARGTTMRGVKDVVTWLDAKDLAAAPDHVPGEDAGAPDEADEAEEAEQPATAAPPRARRTAGTSLTKIEGLGPDDAARLAAAGIRTTEGLLQAAGSAARRRALAKQTGIDGASLLEWVNRADLIRIRGVGKEFSDLLEASGVDSVKELAVRKPANLQAKMAEVNQLDKLVRRAPSLTEVERWVREAKALPPAVTH
jgi:predicted flap endonuclease-1-like 5' DNA nuclease